MLIVVGDDISTGDMAPDGALGMATEGLSLAQILAHPDARITVLPTASEASRLGRELLPVLLGMLASTMTN